MKFLNKLILITVVFLLTFSFSINAQNPEDDFSVSFIKAIVAENIDEIIKLKPTPEFWRLVLEKETKDMTDEEINLKANKNEKLILDIDNISYSAKKENIDLSKIIYKKSKVQKIWDDEKMPFSMTIKYDYHEKEGEFNLSVFKYKGKYFLSEIMVSFDVFNGLE